MSKSQTQTIQDRGSTFSNNAHGITFVYSLENGYENHRYLGIYIDIIKHTQIPGNNKQQIGKKESDCGDDERGLNFLLMFNILSLDRSYALLYTTNAALTFQVSQWVKCWLHYF